MSISIRSAAVIGSGVMGAQIAAHLANCGITVHLLDIVPQSLLPAEEKALLSLEHREVRNRLAIEGIARLHKLKPAPFAAQQFANRIIPGNLEDDLGALSKVDWVIEAIVEREDVKKSCYAKIEPFLGASTIVTSNTSGISVEALIEGRSESFRQRFMGTHFFNPPRYMKLLELIPTSQTDRQLVLQMKCFCEDRLGKGVVIAHDTPNFIANRIGTYGVLVALHEMERGNYTVEEIDAVTGPALGRPKSATLRTLDIVGLDTMIHVSNNVLYRSESDIDQVVFQTPSVLTKLVEKGWHGEKSGQGFYRKTKSSKGSVIEALRLDSMTYDTVQKISSASIQASKSAKSAGLKIKALIGGQDRYSKLAWKLLAPVLTYSASMIPSVADHVADVDNAMKWGFGWELGPFEVWEAIGFAETYDRLESEGVLLPDWVKKRRESGKAGFYDKTESGQWYAAAATGAISLEANQKIISLVELKSRNRTIFKNSGASLIDIGDDVACLEFHSPNNAIGVDILNMIARSADEVDRNWRGLVIANEGRNYCVGANLMLLLMEAQDEEWEEVESIIRLFQNSMQRLKRVKRPVVAAPHRMTLGGGVESCLPADVVLFSPETYFGLVEVGVGLIPSGGGCKEMALRAARRAVPQGEGSLLRGSGNASNNVDLLPFIQTVFETIGYGKTSTSGHDAMTLGLTNAQDRVIANDDYRILEAKKAVLDLAPSYVPHEEGLIRVAGATGKAALQLAVYNMFLGGFLSEHDRLIANKLAHVLAGGDVPEGTLLSEQTLLDMEREAFLSLCGEQKTIARMQFMLSNRKPLRN